MSAMQEGRPRKLISNDKFFFNDSFTSAQNIRYPGRRSRKLFTATVRENSLSCSLAGSDPQYQYKTGHEPAHLHQANAMHKISVTKKYIRRCGPQPVRTELKSESYPGYRLPADFLGRVPGGRGCRC